MRKTLLVLPFAVVFLLTPPRDPARISTIMRDVRAMFAATAAAPGPAVTPALALPASATEAPVEQVGPDSAPASGDGCSLDWSLPYSDENYQELAFCRFVIYQQTGQIACPAPGTVWQERYFQDAFCAPPPGVAGTLPPPPLPGTPLPPAAYP